MWDDAPAEIYVDTGTVTATYCDIQSGWPGEGNIDVDPLLTMDGHLMANSPCFNAGDPDGEYVDQTDIDDEPRVMGNRVDIGVDEWLDSDGDGLPDWWEQHYFGDPLAADPLSDEDGDGRTNLAEYVLGKDPCLAPSAFYVDLSGDDNWDGLAPAWDGEHGPKATIQAAMDACHPHEGDEVIVANGVYCGNGNRDLDFHGKAITVRSASGDPAWCVIDSQGTEEEPHRGFHFHSCETADSALEGVSIRGGCASDGGGVYCHGSSPRLTDCTISGNTAIGDAARGGGVYCGWCSSPILDDCTIIQNTTDEDGGGVHCLDYSSPMLTRCTITQNAADYGGGVTCENHSHPVLIDCAITENTARFFGGGVRCYEGNPILKGCMITRNVGDFGGGGIYCYGSTAGLSNCTITENMGYRGGGCYCNRSNVTLCNCTIARNMAEQGGGGVYCWWQSDVSLTNCRLAQNVAGEDGGGVYCDDQSDPTLTNCILWGDVPNELRVEPGTVTATYCDIQGGWTGEGNMNADPLLTPDGHLTAASPCRDSGEPNGDYSGQTDVDGEPRESDGRVDIGADEWSDSDDDGLPDWWEQLEFGSPLAANPLDDEDGDGRTDLEEYACGTSPFAGPRVFHVDPAGDDNWNGLAATWDGEHGPKATIQAAIDACHPHEGDEVIVADATYTGDGNRDLEFSGKAITVRSSSGDPALCVIDCGGSLTIRHRGFYFHAHETAASVIEGLTISWGDAVEGGGVYCFVGSSPTLTSCRLSANRASLHGGGIYCSYRCNPTLTDCEISGNAGPYGGGVCCSHGSSPTLINCSISENTAGGGHAHGAGLYCSHISSPTLANCVITQNTADYFGGGVYCANNSDPILANCAITANTARYGGGVYCDESSPALAGCTITQNTAEDGGGVCSSGYGGPTLADCILWNDLPNEIHYDTASVTATYCDIQGGWEGEGNIDEDPLFVDPDGPDDDPATWEDNDYHLAAGSPCIDAGDPEFVPLPGEADMDGQMRVWDGDGDGVAIVDMGADEVGSFTFADLNCDGLLNAFDIDAFVKALAGINEQPPFASYTAAHPACDPWLADCNGDGNLNAFDIDPFIALLTGG